MSRSHGTSLVEAVVVAGIIAILAATALYYGAQTVERVRVTVGAE
jgi:Tfp pilus assembly major pilin PilA